MHLPSTTVVLVESQQGSRARRPGRVGPHRRMGQLARNWDSPGQRPIISTDFPYLVEKPCGPYSGVGR